MARMPSRHLQPSTTKKRPVREAVEKEKQTRHLRPSTTKKLPVREAVKEEKKAKEEKDKKVKKGKKGKKGKQEIWWRDKNYMNDMIGEMDDWHCVVHKIDTVETLPGRGPRRGFVYCKVLPIWGGARVKVSLHVAKRRFPMRATWTPQYAAKLFPKLTPEDTAAVAELYADLGSGVTQENLIIGEAIFICPTYFLADAFRNHTYKAEFAIPPALHGQDSSYYWPSLVTLNPGTLLGTPITFNNTDFIDAFAQSFASFAISLDPNIKVDPSSITPQWDLYDLSTNEIVFNKTEDDLPDIRPIETKKDLLARCSFWHSLNARTAQ
ncbi:hypothetical protein PQX77_002895 [Marasmius sp. AFHP31]|nr:hypothetical protein PQX77_002895 [Marasmius sp. AFHP31]